jgi:hypothetical protein
MPTKQKTVKNVSDIQPKEEAMVLSPPKDVGKKRTSQRITQKLFPPNLLDIFNKPPSPTPPKVVTKRKTVKRKIIEVKEPSPPKELINALTTTEEEKIPIVKTLSPPKVDVVEKLQLPPKVVEKLQSPPKVLLDGAPSIITIVIYCHGMDIVETPFTDINVRILSVSGNTGAIAFGDSNEIDRIKSIYHDTTTKYQKLLAEKGIKQKIVEALHPSANTCKRMPKLAFNYDDNDFNLQSTYQFLKANFANSKKKDKYADVAKITAHKREYDEFTKQSVLADIESGDVHKIYSPVINRLYGCNSVSKQAEIKKNIKARKDAKMGMAGHRTSLEEGFGVFVLDTCNYSGPVKIDDELTSKKGYNKPFIDFITTKQTVITSSNTQYTLQDGDFDLKTLVEHLHSLGFDIINIIDLGCRACSIQDASIRSEIIAKENLQSTMINTQI